METERLIQRINELAHKAKAEGLSAEELQERDVLRQEYISSVRSNLVAHLENTYIVTPDGKKRKLQKRNS